MAIIELLSLIVREHDVINLIAIKLIILTIIIVTIAIIIIVVQSKLKLIEIWV